jgi:hypothetical protein
MTYRRSYQMPELEWRQIVADYRDGYPPQKIGEMHLCSYTTVRTILKLFSITIRSKREARELAISLGRCSEPGYCPTPDVIDQVTCEIRERGFWGGDGKRNNRTWHPPWSPEEYERRKVIPIPSYTIPEINLFHHDKTIILNAFPGG